MLLVTVFGLLLGLGSARAAVQFRLVPLMADGSGLVIAEANGTEGAICPEGFGLREATVVCRQLGLGWGRFVHQVILKLSFLL